ncbi:MAG: hypothetical protein E6J34_19430 [Chloroflexi bacterium]|nr:MAG: hypothetical protein E6J34_19430 [Chloroflexota bacterium]
MHSLQACAIPDPASATTAIRHAHHRRMMSEPREPLGLRCFFSVTRWRHRRGQALVLVALSADPVQGESVGHRNATRHQRTRTFPLQHHATQCIINGRSLILR